MPAAGPGAGFEFHVHQFQLLLHLLDPARIGAHLFARQYAVVDPAHQMRSAQYLQAAVLAIGPVQRDHDAAHVRIHAAVVVPVAVVLVPFPGAAVVGLLGREFGVVVVDLAAEHVFHRVDHAVGAGGQAVDAVAGVIPQGHAGGFAFGVLAVVQAGAQGRVLLHGVAHQGNLFGVEQRSDDHVAVALVPCALLRGESTGQVLVSSNTHDGAAVIIDR